MKKIYTPLFATLVLAAATTVMIPVRAGALEASTGPESPTTWFSVTAKPSANDGGPKVTTNTIQSRTAVFDATSAAHSLVDTSDWAQADRGERVVVPSSAGQVTIQTFAGKLVAVNIREVALRFGNDSESGAAAYPTIEVIGQIGEGDLVAASAGLVFRPDAKGSYELVGELQNEPSGHSTSIVSLGESVYRLEELVASDHAKDATADAVVPSEEASGVKFRRAAPFAPSLATSQLAARAAAVSEESSASDPVVDIAVAYKQGSYPNDILAIIDGNVQDTNVALANSGLNVRVRLKFTQYIPAAQAAYLDDDLSALANGDGSYAQFRSRLDASGVDLMAVQVPVAKPLRSYPGFTACGQGSLPIQDSGGAWSNQAAFSVSAASTGCEANWWTFAHEVGHNLGGNHNPEDVCPQCYQGPFLYARGHRTSSGMDVMSYDSATYPYTLKRLQYSNPAVNFLLTSVPSGTTGSTGHRNASSINDLDYVIAGYRTLNDGWDVPPYHPFYAQIQWVMSVGLITAGSDQRYRTDDPVARGAMAAIVYRRAGSPTYSPPGISPFPDVPTSDVFYKAITWANSQGIMTGYSNGNFGPADDVTRGQTASILYKAVGSPAYTPPAVSPFPDVATTNAFYKPITWMVANGIASGYSNGNFGPADDVTRGQMAVFLYNMQGM